MTGEIQLGRCDRKYSQVDMTEKIQSGRHDRGNTVR